MFLNAERSCHCSPGNDDGQKHSDASCHPLIVLKLIDLTEAVSRGRKDENGT